MNGFGFSSRRISTRFTLGPLFLGFLGLALPMLATAQVAPEQTVAAPVVRSDMPAMNQAVRCRGDRHADNSMVRHAHRAMLQPCSLDDGPPPDFCMLDTNRDGRISRSEAAAFSPLLNDYDHLAHHGHQITRAAYERWAYQEP